MLERVAVTGASGFLGAHLVEDFTRRGAQVTPLVRTIDARCAKWAGAVTLDSVLRDPTLLGHCDVLVHAAAVRHRHGVDHAAYRASNVALVASLIRAVAGRAQRFVLVSSVGVYGFPGRLPVTEEHPYAPATTYSETKVEAEQLARQVAHDVGVDLCIVRPTIVYGRGDTNGMLDKMVGMVRAGTYRIVGPGDNTLHHTHVDDVVDGVFLAATHPAAIGEHFILCGPETISLARLSSLVANATGRRISRIHVPLRLGRTVASAVEALASRGIAFSSNEPPINHEKLDVMTRSVAFDASKAVRLLGYTPRVFYEEGLRRTLSGET